MLQRVGARRSSPGARSPTRDASGPVSPRPPGSRPQSGRFDRDPLRLARLQAAELDEPAVHDPGARRRDRRREPEGRDPAGRAPRGPRRSLLRPRRRPRPREGRRRGRAARAHRRARRGSAGGLHARAPRVPHRHRARRPALCRDGEGRAVVVEIKRVGEIAGVEQLSATRSASTSTPGSPRRAACSSPRGSSRRPSVFATSRGIDCVEVALDDLREHDAPRLKLF